MNENIIIPALVFFFLFGLPTLCVTIVVLKKMGRSGHKTPGGQLNAQETRVMQEIHQGLTQLEKRIQALETIIIDKK